MKPEGNSSQRKGSNYNDVLHTYDDLNPIPVCSAVLGCLVITRDLLSSVASKWLKFSIVKALLIYPLAIWPLGTGLDNEGFKRKDRIAGLPAKSELPSDAPQWAVIMLNTG